MKYLQRNIKYLNYFNYKNINLSFIVLITSTLLLSIDIILALAFLVKQDITLLPIFYYSFSNIDSTIDYFYYLSFISCLIILFILAVEDYHWYAVHLLLLILLISYSLFVNIFYAYIINNDDHIYNQLFLALVFFIPINIVALFYLKKRDRRRKFKSKYSIKYIKYIYERMPLPIADSLLLTFIPLWFNFKSVLLILFILLSMLLIYYFIVRDTKAKVPLYTYVCCSILIFILFQWLGSSIM